ncbi:MAG TPA: hypothetical protein VIA06_19945 [Candidatus Dormibacteraeota bacterium]|nr:hypothetical protein [Candidatus Dormibacteraeota bacterium]
MSGWVAETYERSRRLPGYRATLDQQGASGPGDVAFAGDAATVADQLRRLVDAGATELVAMPFGFDQDHRRTLELLGDLSGPG